MRCIVKTSRKNNLSETAYRPGENLHFFKLMVTPAMRRSVSTLPARLICSCQDLEKIAMSCKYTRASWYLIVKRNKSIVHLTVPGHVTETAFK